MARKASGTEQLEAAMERLSMTEMRYPEFP